MNKNNIELINVYKSYYHNLILNNINLKIDLGKENIIGLIGPNGAGKTTLLKIISGLLLVNDGMVKYTFDDNLKNNAWAKSNIAYLPAGERGLLNRVSVYHNAMYYCVLKGLDDKNAREKIKNNAKELNIDNLLDKRFDRLSTGQKKKVQLLCALSSGMSIILLDEPSNGLDMDATFDLIKLLKKACHNCHYTIIISSHDIEFMEELCNEFYFIFDGKIAGHFDHYMTHNSIKEEYRKIRGEL